MRVEFRIEAHNRAPHHIADATVVFDAREGAAAGLVIGNWAVWARGDGRPGVIVTAPATRPRVNEASARSFSSVRAARRSMVALDIRERIVAELWRQHPDLLIELGVGVADEDEAAADSVPVAV